MAWIDRPKTSKTQNPAVKFYEWSSNDKCMKCYDKEKGEKSLVSLPFKFVIIENYHTVKGWHDESESRIYSNEVLYTGSDELNVRSHKGCEIAKGLYKDIRTKVKENGGHYSRSIYIIDKNGDLANLSLKGSAVSQYSNFIDLKKGAHPMTKWDKNWVSIAAAEDRKKGSVKFSVPVFKVIKEIKDKAPLMKKVDILQEYMVEYLSDSSKLDRNNSVVNEYNEKEEEEVNDDVPF